MRKRERETIKIVQVIVKQRASGREKEQKFGRKRKFVWCVDKHELNLAEQMVEGA